MNTYILIGFLFFIGLAIFLKWSNDRNSVKPYLAKNRPVNPLKEKQQDKRNLRLIVAYNYGETQDTISDNATSEIVRSTMQSINWNIFHIVQLEDQEGNALHVSGSLADDGLASGYVTEDDHTLKVKPPQSVEEMTIILMDFLKGEEVWAKKYSYQ